jgi:hypothetical protein
MTKIIQTLPASSQSLHPANLQIVSGSAEAPVGQIVATFERSTQSARTAATQLLGGPVRPGVQLRAPGSQPDDIEAQQANLAELVQAASLSIGGAARTPRTALVKSIGGGAVLGLSAIYLGVASGYNVGRHEWGGHANLGRLVFTYPPHAVMPQFDDLKKLFSGDSGRLGTVLSCVKVINSYTDWPVDGGVSLTALGKNFGELGSAAWFDIGGTLSSVATDAIPAVLGACLIGRSRLAGTALLVAGLMPAAFDTVYYPLSGIWSQLFPLDGNDFQGFKADLGAALGISPAKVAATTATILALSLPLLVTSVHLALKTARRHNAIPADVALYHWLSATGNSERLQVLLEGYPRLKALEAACREIGPAVERSPAATLQIKFFNNYLIQNLRKELEVVKAEGLAHWDKGQADRSFDAANQVLNVFGAVLIGAMPGVQTLTATLAPHLRGIALATEILAPLAPAVQTARALHSLVMDTHTAGREKSRQLLLWSSGHAAANACTLALTATQSCKLMLESSPQGFLSMFGSWMTPAICVTGATAIGFDFLRSRTLGRLYAASTVQP